MHCDDIIFQGAGGVRNSRVTGVQRCALPICNSPDAMVWIYRAVPEDVSTFNPGDWVTTSKAYARDHMAGEDGWHVMARRVKARELYTDGNSINEWAYWPTRETF